MAKKSGGAVGRASRWLVVLSALVLGLFWAAPARGAANLPSGFVDETVASGLDRPAAIAMANGGRLFVAQENGLVRIIENGQLLPTPFIDLRPEVNEFVNRGLLGMALHPNYPATPHVFLLYTYDPPQAANFTGSRGRDGDGQRVARLVRVTANAATGHKTASPGSMQVILGANSTWANIGDPGINQNNLGSKWTCMVNGAPWGTPIQDCMPSDGLSHSVGSLRFASDGSLFVSIGDAASWTGVDKRAIRSQQNESLTGKILRIDPNTGFGVPSNPLYNPAQPDRNSSKMYSKGLRNPFRFTLQPGTDIPFIGDVGWSSWEEINTGKNKDFGWPCYEGGNGTSVKTRDYQNMGYCQNYPGPVQAPLQGWNRTGTGGAALAGTFYTGSSFPSQYNGVLFMGDFVQERMEYMVPGTWTRQPFATNISWTDLLVGTQDGNLYYTDLLGGRVGRIRYTGGGNPPTTPPPTGGGGGLSATYWDNVNFTGNAVSRIDPNVNFFWGEGRPAPSLGPNSFSARWTGTITPPRTEQLTIEAWADDGFRLWLNGNLVADQWGPGAPYTRMQSVTIPVTAGQPVAVRLESVERSGGARTNLYWQSPSIGRTAIPTSALSPEGAPPPSSNNGLRAEYYDNVDLTGRAVVRVDPTVNFAWGAGSPDPSIDPNTFSARWTGQLIPPATEQLTVEVWADDGFRLWLGGTLRRDQWWDGPPYPKKASWTLSATAGQPIDFRLEMIERTGGANARVWVSSPSMSRRILPNSMVQTSN